MLKRWGLSALFGLMNPVRLHRFTSVMLSPTEMLQKNNVLDNCPDSDRIGSVMRKIDMHYGMFTDEGNAAVAAIVKMAIERCFSYTNLENELIKLSKIACFEEATDTAVRECAFVGLREGLAK
jgi:hypothetical protein